ncbi:hypothetical protein GGS21DRAFT_486729 [Xylaria nigripes]|nr:hypothetical protein GGS21DRAFT_486729 [Xylaria nigripes]
MSEKPIFVATHPRACSTAFERVFMTRQDILQCAHEPFGDAFYFGPERLGSRYEDNEVEREESGFSQTTYRDVLDRLNRDSGEGKRIFVKDMAYYLMPPDNKTPSIAPSLRKDAGTTVEKGWKPVSGHTNGANGNSHVKGVNGYGRASDVKGCGNVNGVDKSKSHDLTRNPTVLPREALQEFHWTFLIRHPRWSIPSYIRCCSPPLSKTTGWDHFLPNEVGYVELRRLFDYLREQGLVGPSVAGQVDGTKTKGSGVTITVLDADDLLDKPEQGIRLFCEETGVPYCPSMLEWNEETSHKYASDAFSKWKGWHNDAIKSTGLTARTHPKKVLSRELEDEEWRRKYGEEAQKLMRACVDENTPHYEYLKSFALKF